MDPANKERIEAAAKKIVDWVAATTPKINALSNTAQITLKDGRVLTGAQIKELWGKADFLVTDRTDFGTDRGGAVIGFLSQMALPTVEGWDVHIGGLNFILFHEIMHMSAQARDYSLLQWNIFLANGGTVLSNGTAPGYNSTNPQFVNGEIYVNDASKQIAILINEVPLLVDTSNGDASKWVPPYGM